MRFSKLLTQTIKKAQKGKSIDKEIDTIIGTVEAAVEAYKGSSKGALKANKNLTIETVSGCVSMSMLDEESLLQVIKQRHSAAVAATCTDIADENFSLNAELCRAIATDANLLGAAYWLGNADTEANALL